MADMDPLCYAVITLRRDEDEDRDEVATVVKHLKAQERVELANWLEERKDRYGGSNDGWRPFADRKIGDFLKSISCENATDLIEDLDDDLNNIEIIREKNISIYFVDAFALFLQKYAKLAERIAFALAKEASCCFVLTSELPSKDQDYLLSKYYEDWRPVRWAYKQGYSHCKAVEPDDLEHFRNELARLSPKEGGPTYGVAADLKAILPKDGPFPGMRSISE